jgi:hypothetical protein
MNGKIRLLGRCDKCRESYKLKLYPQIFRTQKFLTQPRWLQQNFGESTFTFCYIFLQFVTVTW